MNNSRRDVFKTLIILALPTCLEELLSTMLQYVDTAMVGQLGQEATAAVSVTTTVTWLLGSLPHAIGIAVLTLISKAIGEGDKEKIRKVSSQALVLSVLSGIVLGTLSLLLCPFIPVWMGAEENIRHTASIYFAIISLPMIFRNMTSILGAAVRGTKDTVRPMFISFGGNVINIGLNYVLIYVMDLGVTGAAIGTAVSYTLTGMATFIVYRRNELLRWERFIPDLRETGRILIYDLPLMAHSAVSCMGYIVFAGIVARLGTTVFAAHSIAVNAETLFYISCYGLRTAAQTLVGISAGEGNRKKFEHTASVSILTILFMMAVSGAVLYFVSSPLMGLLTSSGEVASLGAEMLRLVALSEPFFGLMVVSQGIFYGLGRNNYPFIIEIISMWGIRILFTALCVYVWGFGLREIWFCMIADNVFKALTLTLPLAAGKLRRKLFVFGREEA